MYELSNLQSAHATTVAEPERFRLSRRELLLIVAFWIFIAVLTTANRLFDPRGLGFQVTVSSGPVAMAFLESFLWALLTPAIFWMTWRFSPDRGSRAGRIMLFVAAGIAVALLLDVVTDAVRGAFFPFPQRRGSRPPPWFGFVRPWVLNDLIVYMGVLAAGLARVFSLRFHAQREQSVRIAGQLRAQLAEARLDALRMQLDPHFLFNTLHAISSLVERDPRGVRRMISRLSELLRHTMDGSSEQEIPLRQELQLLRRYLEIMEVRFQGRLEVTTDVDERALEALVPNLVLQPIVENAFKHGVSRVEGIGRIAVRGAIKGDDLVLTVENNGPLSDGGVRGEGTGVGIKNTRARLEQLYGSAQSFVLRAVDGGGTAAEIRLPYHTGSDLRAPAVATTA